MADRTVAVILGAKVAGFISGMKAATSAAQDLASKGLDKIGKNEQAISGLTTQIGALGLGLTAFAGLAVKRFADFDAAMSNVEATGEDARGSIEALREAAIQAGADTAFSATEAAGAIEELSKAGVTSADILGGGLDGALSLAASGSLEVADAAGIASVALTQFGLSGADVGHVADLLAAGAGKAMGDVSDLGNALKQSGLVAAQTGLSIEETVTALTAFAAAGLLGSDAGTSLKTMLQRLSNPAGEAAELMAELGISAYDASGQFVGLEDLSGQLRTAMEDMTPAQRNAAMAIIFGSDAVRAANVLYTEGAEGIAEWSEAVDDSGYASEVAATKLDNLKGDMEALGGSVETAFIKMGESANGPLRGIVQGATNVVNAFGEMPPAAQGALMAITGGGGLVLLGIAGMGKMLVAINNARDAMKALGLTAKTTGLIAGGLGAALGVAAIALTVWAQNAADAKARTEAFKGTLDDLGYATDQTVSHINELLSTDQTSWIEGLFGKDPESLIDKAEKFGLAVEDLQGYILGQADAVDRVNAATQEYIDQHRTIDGGIRSGVKAQVEDLVGVLDQEASALTAAEKAQAQKAYADRQAGIAAEQNASGVQTATGAIEEQTDALWDNTEAQRENAGLVLDLRDAQRGLEQSYADAAAALKENGATLDITTEKGRENQAALDDIAQSTWVVIESMQENGATQEDLQATMATSRERFIGVATSMGLSREAAEKLADQLGLIPKDVRTTVTVESQEAQRRAQAILDKIREIDGSTATFTIYGVTRNTTDGTRVNAGQGNQVERASGGPVTGGVTYLVGENGPEYFTAPATGMIRNHAASRAQGRPVAGVGSSSGSYAGGSQNLTVLVENPWTGEQLLARARVVADRAVSENNRSHAMAGV